MFTGIVTEMGEIAEADDGRFRIACGFDAASIAIGASIACDGCCLTVTHVEADGPGRSVFGVDVSNETLARTTLGSWVPGQAVNLERSLKLGDELGGHLVTGHIDGVAEIRAAAADGSSKRFDIECPAALAQFVAEKGCVALDGVSLTVNWVADTRFGVSIIPHTLRVTKWGQKGAGGRLNMEVDLMARYVARLTQQRSTSA
jgi:riboflavin synthase